MNPGEKKRNQELNISSP